MISTSKSATSGASALNAKLAALQQSASVVSDQLRGSNLIFYKHLAELYLWWRDAQAVSGYIEDAYERNGKQYKRKIKSGINFAPLFWLAWGFDNGLTDDKAGRWSRVLNKLHKLYETEKQYHTDSVAKLQNYIDQNGGVDGLVGYGKESEDEADIGIDEDGEALSDDDADRATPATEPRLDIDGMLVQLYGEAKEFYAAVDGPQIVKLDQTIPLTTDGLGMVLVRKLENGYQLVGATNDETIVRPVAMHSYLNDFAALSPSIRCIVETLSTQCLPKSLQVFHDDLVDAAKASAGSSGKKAVRRLMYRHARREFVLSPTRSNSGVVTVAKPRGQVLQGITHDSFLSTRSRRVLERKLISARDFNLYSATNKDVIPAYSQAGVACHAIRLQNRFADGDYLHLDFWPFYESLPAPRGQLVSSMSDVGVGTWHASLSFAWLRDFASTFTVPWLQSIGSHIKREHQRVLRLSFGKNALRVQFVQREGRFESDVEVGIEPGIVAGRSISVDVLSKDFVIAMHAIAELGVVTKVAIEVDSDAVALRYSTSAADYSIFIPTCSSKGARSSHHFMHCEPAPFVMDEPEHFADQREGDFDEAH